VENPTLAITDLLTVIHERHSSRVPFNQERPVSQQNVRRILEAARWAPTAHNMQNFEIVVVDDKLLLERIGNLESRVSAEFIQENFQQLSFSEEELLQKKVGVLAAMFPPSWTTRAPLGQVNDEVRSLRDTMLGSPTLLFVIYDSRKRAPASAGDFLGIMAQSLGVGVQIISSVGVADVEEEIKRMLDIPHYMRIAFGMRVGFPFCSVGAKREIGTASVSCWDFGPALARRPALGVRGRTPVNGVIKGLVRLLALSTVFLLAACGQPSGGPGSTSPSPSATMSVSPTPTTTPEPSLAPSPSASPTVSASPAWPPAGFTTGGVSGGSSATIVNVTAVRVGAHTGYDRVVIEFSGAVPSYTVTPQSDSRFTLTPKGGTVTLEGTNGILITLQHINWTAYAGPNSLRPDFTDLREARLIQNFEGVQQWALGIAGVAAVRVFTLTSPARLVVDVTAQ
jgi:nitroreductase